MFDLYLAKQNQRNLHKDFSEAFNMLMFEIL